MVMENVGPDAQPLRADARRNRELILVGATRVFRILGPDAPMETIAREAGVGVGTLYRRFPDRTALLLAVVRDDLTRLLGRTLEAGASAGTHWDRLVRALRLAEELGSTVRLTARLPSEPAGLVRSDLVVQRTRSELFAAMDGLLRAAQQEGSVRLDVGIGDIAQLFALLLEMGVDGGLLPLARARAIVLDGLRPQTEATLPGCPLGPEDLTY